MCKPGAKRRGSFTEGFSKAGSLPSHTCNCCWRGSPPQSSATSPSLLELPLRAFTMSTPSAASRTNVLRNSQQIRTFRPAKELRSSRTSGWMARASLPNPYTSYAPHFWYRHKDFRRGYSIIIGNRTLCPSLIWSHYHQHGPAKPSTHWPKARRGSILSFPARLSLGLVEVFGQDLTELAQIALNKGSYL